MNGAGLNRKKSPARLSTLATTFVLAWVQLPPCAAQLSATPANSAIQAPGTITRSAENPPLLELPPSTVSPAIERFVRESGRDLPNSPKTPSPTRPGVVRVARPTQRPRPDPLGGLEGRDLPAPLPAPATSPTTDGRPATDANPLATDMKLKPAPFEATDRRFPINLAAALRLSDARPLVVAAAQASVWVAEADLTRAKVLWLPTASFAADYIRHDGGGPDFNKGIMTAPSVNFFYAGAAALQSVNFTDVIFQPLQARQVLNSRHWDVQTSKNDALLQTADAYFQVHQARGTYAGALYTVDRGKELVRRIEDLSKELAVRYEIERARNLLADLEQRATLARQEWRVQSANLTQVLRLDPRAVVEPLEHDHAQVTLIDPGRTLDDLMPIALTNRPELASREALVQAAQYAVRREKNRPLLPLLQLNGFQSSGNGLIQAGIFGLGPNNSLNQYRGRDDVNVQLIWQLDGLGIGNLARIKAQRGGQSRAVIELRQVQDRVAADVNRALARVQSAAARVLQADRSLRTGIIAFNGQVEGIGQTKRFGNVLILIFRPEEAVYSLDLLNIAFNEYFATVADYNRAQFDLFHALGYPARELAALRPPGDIAPVDTARPAYLPPVGNGPPPATR